MRSVKKFTLIELMVAIAVFTVFMVLIVQFFVVANKLWNTSEKETKLSGKANLVLSAIEQFVRNAKIGTSSAPFYINHAVVSEGNDKLTDMADIMKNRFNTVKPVRWEQDTDAYKKDMSAKLVFAVSTDNVLLNGAWRFYIVGFVQAQDRLQLRVISSKNSNFRTLLNKSRSELLDEFEKPQSTFISSNDSEKGSGMPGNGNVTYDIIDHVTRFRVYPMILNPNFKASASGGSDNASALLMMAPEDLTKSKMPYAILVEIALLGDDDFKTWKELMTAGGNTEPEPAKKFRERAERTFSRLIYIGPVKEVN